ncbi:hypothetical protein [Enterococcus lactis]
MNKEYIYMEFSFPINVSVDQIYIYPQFEILPGYLHLLEHMIIRNNKVELEKYELKNNIYNALTDKKKMNFVFIHSNFEEIPISFSIDTFFREEDFNTEKKIIIEERKLYPDNYPSVDKILGTEDQIKEFKLSILQNILRNNKFSFIHFNYASCNQKINEKRKEYVPISINSIFNSVIIKSKGYIILKETFVTKLIIYFLRILEFSVMGIKFNIKTEEKRIEVSYYENTDLPKLLAKKSQILKRYKIFLNEFRFHNQEMIYLIENFGCVIEFEKYWEELTWENLLY